MIIIRQKEYSDTPHETRKIKLGSKKVEMRDMTEKQLRNLVKGEEMAEENPEYYKKKKRLMRAGLTAEGMFGGTLVSGISQGKGKGKIKLAPALLTGAALGEGTGIILSKGANKTHKKHASWAKEELERRGLEQKEYSFLENFIKKQKDSKISESLSKHQLKNYTPNEKDLIMEIEDIFSITGKGTVVTGKLCRDLSIGDRIAIVGGNTLKTKAVSIETFRKLIDHAKKGDNVGILLEKTIHTGLLKRGDKIYKILRTKYFSLRYTPEEMNEIVSSSEKLNLLDKIKQARKNNKYTWTNLELDNAGVIRVHPNYIEVNEMPPSSRQEILKRSLRNKYNMSNTDYHEFLEDIDIHKSRKARKELKELGKKSGKIALGVTGISAAAYGGYKAYKHHKNRNKKK